ncbi:hypothetical protein GGR21_001343 [Dysgonomonas hofstadii]|uniref:BACON domain-containing protein n=1 Tax=Dysgonomonas hofstadii TaxID=637886 RepID=A0A840CHL7_9BACT|nr:BACON domain-containing protein [Dysgonomonas hofstadii]MBB4035450.1 hypothetical protein [Dysgonomonas hofstadii]
MNELSCKCNLKANKPLILNYMNLLFFLALIVFCVSCSDEDSDPALHYNIETSVDTLVFDPEGGEMSFTLNTNAKWQIHTNANWLTYTPTADSKNASEQKITVSVPEFVDYTTRTAIISIKSGDIDNDVVKRKFILITQVGPEKPERGPGIWSKQDLVEFGEAISGNQDYSQWSDENGIVNLMDNIDFGADKIPCMGGMSTNNNLMEGSDAAFNGTFNGNGHTIKGQLDGGDKMIVALFTRIGPKAIIENLIVDITGISSFNQSNGHLATIVGFSLSADDGYIKNCIAKGSLTQTGTNSTRVGGIVAYGRTKIVDCQSNVDIQAVSNRVGGIAGAGGGSYTFENCINNGNISVTCDVTQTGGIVGQLNGQTLLGCINNGKISVTAIGAVAVGGIAGQAQGTSNIGNDGDGYGCENNGEITLVATDLSSSDNATVGGIAGNVTTATAVIKNSLNNALVKSNCNKELVSAGGIAGKVTAATSITLSTNSINGTVIAAQNAGGIVGKATAALSISACTNLGNIDVLTNATLPTAGRYIGGIIGQKGSATYTDCNYGGFVMSIAGTSANAEGH